jgi:hypothetical protein
MKKMFFCFVVWALFFQVGVTNEDPHWTVRFYQDPNAGGLWTKLDVSSDGTSANPIDGFEKYHLKDEISEIRYTLPPGVFVVCFTGTFLNIADDEVAKFIYHNLILNNLARRTGIKLGNGILALEGHSPILKALAERAGIKLGRGILALEGSGSEQVVKLWEIDDGRFDNHIRSAQLIKP